MRDIAVLTDLYPVRARETRVIAEGIWDFEERKNLLEFINEYERLAREVKARERGVVLPLRAERGSSTR
jgi:hypothetical protein